MSTVVGLFRRRRDSFHAWWLLRRHGFRTNEVRIVPCDRFVGERLHPTIAHARTLHGYVCASSGVFIGAFVGIILGIMIFAAADPSAVFGVAAAGVGVGGVVGGLVGRYDPANFAFVPVRHAHNVIERNALLICVAASGERAAQAHAVLQAAQAAKVFASDVVE